MPPDTTKFPVSVLAVMSLELIPVIVNGTAVPSPTFSVVNVNTTDPSSFTLAAFLDIEYVLVKLVSLIVTDFEASPLFKAIVNVSVPSVVTSFVKTKDNEAVPDETLKFPEIAPED